MTTQPASSPGLRTLEPGVVVHDLYELDSQLGEGGMGVVWSAKRTTDGTLVALKFLKSGAESPDAKRRFAREARAAGSVVHPHVVRVFEVFDLDEAMPVMVMERLEGESLVGLLRRNKRLTPAVTAELLLPVISAVGSAHSQGIVHRDLKPDNIFLSRTKNGSTVVKVLDFGIAKVTQLDGRTTVSLGLTGTGEVLGTPNYMSPEQVFGERDLDHRADIWALGVILYECLSGVLPTQGTNIGQVLKVIVTGLVRPLAEVAPDLPGDLCELVKRMLSRNREDRPENLLEVMEVLSRYADVDVPSFEPPSPGLSHSLPPKTVPDVKKLVVGEPVANPLAPTADSGSLLPAVANLDTVDVSSGSSLLQTESGDSTPTTAQDLDDTINPLSRSHRLSHDTLREAQSVAKLFGRRRVPFIAATGAVVLLAGGISWFAARTSVEATPTAQSAGGFSSPPVELEVASTATPAIDAAHEAAAASASAIDSASPAPPSDSVAVVKESSTRPAKKTTPAPVASPAATTPKPPPSPTGMSTITGGVVDSVPF